MAGIAAAHLKLYICTVIELTGDCGARQERRGCVRIGDLLAAAGWESAAAPGDLAAGTDLLPAVGQRRGPGQTTLRWLSDQRIRGARLALGFREPEGRIANAWLGPRLVWYDDRDTYGRSCLQGTAVVSSRMGRSVEAHGDWFAVIRQVCGGISDQESMMTADKATADAYIHHCCTAYGIPIVTYHFSRHRSWPAWLKALRDNPRGRHAVYVSPPLGSPSQVTSHAQAVESLREVPVQDRLLVALAQRLIVGKLRADGHIHRLLRARMDVDRQQTNRIQLAVGTELLPRATAADCLRRGATCWNPLTWNRSVTRQSTRCGAVGLAAGSHQRTGFVPAEVDPDREFLIHSTRRCIGPWPGQTQSQFLDDLLWQRVDADHRPLATLNRIIRQRRLTAGCSAIRGSQPVVCFSHESLRRRAARRIYRRHRVRWDNQPFGLAIAVAWGRRRGIRPVVYGGEATWQQLAPETRPFFQIATTRSAAGLNWREEREWRHLGNLSLIDLPRDQAVVFVPPESVSDELLAISPWPIVALPSTGGCR